MNHTTSHTSGRIGGFLGIVAIGLGLAVPAALGQSSGRAIFVANNGNLEGSVSAFRVNADGTLTLANRIVTGTRPTISDPCPGCNPYEIALSPNGRFLATGHAATNDPTEQISIFDVAANAKISQLGAYPVPGTPMDIAWIDDELLAVERTDSDQVAVYRFDPVAWTLSQVDVDYAGVFSTYLAVHPTGNWLYVTDSGSSPYAIRVFRIETDGTLTLIQTQYTSSYYPLEVTLSHDGTKLYAAGGITHVVLGFNVGVDGMLAPMAGSPFPEFGSSPSNVAVSTDDAFLLVGHGTDATVRSATINPATGALTYTGYMFDVGIQGSLGDVQVLENLFFVTDNYDGPTGVYSFTLNANGSFTQNGALVSTGGISPRSIATWNPPPLLLGDMNCDGVVNNQDIDHFVQALFHPDQYVEDHDGDPYPFCDILHGDFTGDGLVNNQDIDGFVTALFGG